MTSPNGLEYLRVLSEYQNTLDFSKTFNSGVNTMLFGFLLGLGVLYGSFLLGPYVMDSLQNLYTKRQERREEKSVETP